MSKYQKLNIIGGWLVFAIAFLTYMLTLEPTASMWDCGEFIATSYKLEVGHPPGTPFFFLINRLAAMFAPDPSGVAYAINAMSALESALTIAFMFWSISHLARRVYRIDVQELSSAQRWSTLAAAAVGSLAYAFTDTFWFSAVEAEVYALSSLFTAVVFWAILKWEEVADQPGSNRWLVLIAYLMGLSIGAHILNLLAIPALVFIYYFKRFPGRKKIDMWKPAVIAVVILGVFYMLTPTVVAIGAWVDRLVVNGLGMPVNSGLVGFVVLVFAGLGYGVYRSHRAGRALLNTILLSAMMVVIGFSTYGVVLIRSSVNPPMNSNHPSDPYTLLSFLNRDQYGSTPLLHGQTYASPRTGNVFKDAFYLDDQGKYVKYRALEGFEYDPATTMMLPRMYSANPNHVREYKNWADIQGRKVRTTYGGEVTTVPTFGENLKFFFTYQLNYMYWRYFLWNFVGRQSDIQGNGLTQGNWMSGITPLDELYLGPQDGLPSEVEQNKGRNTYFFLPFILGMLGMFFHLRRDGRNFAVVMLLFFMTGLAIILYLNQTPSQPRERDYAYAGSFYAFALWIGIGLIPVFERLARWFKGRETSALAVAFVVCMSVPAVLAVQNWDDHDRSGRTFARDIGFNYLNSTLPNSILINYGDNDTFPVWYAQEVEELRPDVRVMNASYISGDWYIDQMRRASNKSEPVPFSLPKAKYSGAANRLFPFKEMERPGGGVWTAKEVMAIVNSDDPRTKIFDSEGTAFDFIPARRIALPVDRAAVIESGIVRAEDAHLIEDTIYLELGGSSALSIDNMMMLDLLANFDWKRPLYFTSAVGMADFGLLKYSGNEAWSYFQQDGSAYRLVPIKSPIGRNFSVGRIDVERLYDNMMNKFGYGNLRDSSVYVDTFIENTTDLNQYRANFARLAGALLEAGDTVRAVEVLDRAMVELPVSQLRMDEQIVMIIEAYWMAGEMAKGDALAQRYIDVVSEYLAYYDRFTGSKKTSVQGVVQGKERNLYMLYAAGERQGRRAQIEEMVKF